jgi:hypothetical protein
MVVQIPMKTRDSDGCIETSNGGESQAA